MLRRNVEGLIVIPAHGVGNASLLLGRQFERLPIVTLDRPIEGSRFDSLLVENERGARLGTEHLIRLGHKRVTYIGLTDDLYTMQRRHAGYAAGMEGAGLESKVAFLSGALDNSRAVVRNLLSVAKPPTAIFCANNLITRRVLHSLQSMDLHPPEPVALVGFDDVDTADLIRPGITVVRQPHELLGRTATDVLFEELTGGRGANAGKHRVLPV